MRCFRKLLGISYRDHITNDAVRDRIRQAIAPCDDILTTVKKRKLKWFGHVSRSSGLAKTILQGTVQGGRRRGRQKKRWENNIAEWTGLKFCHAVREAENKIKWRERVGTSLASQRLLTTGQVQVQVQVHTCGADGRSGGRCTVTCLPNFLRWVVYHIFLPMMLRRAREIR